MKSTIRAAVSLVLVVSLGTLGALRCDLGGFSSDDNDEVVGLPDSGGDDVTATGDGKVIGDTTSGGEIELPPDYYDVVPQVPVDPVTTKAELVVKYSQANAQVGAANKSFIEAYQAYATADPVNDPAGFITKTNAMTAAGDAWVNAIMVLNMYGKQFADVKADAPILTAPTVPITLPYNVGSLIGTTKEKRAKIEKDYADGVLDDNQYAAALNQLKKTQILDAAGTGLSAGSAVAGGFVVKAGLVLAGASGGVVVGGAILGAAAIGVGVKLLWNYCSSGKQDSLEGGYCAMSTYDTTVGGTMPLQFPGKGTLIIEVEGKPPIVIENFGVEGGQMVEIDWDPNDPNGAPIISPVDPSQFTDCANVAGVSATPSPADPGPSEGVTVTATTIPAIAGCTINFSISGTDGYSKSESPTTDASGTASFYIPGGAEGVVDTVTISVGSQTTTVVYTF